jgi:hypothetical protein
MAGPLPPLNPALGRQVTSRQFSLLEMVERAWGPEFSAPDHGIYQFSNGRRFDSTDMGTTGIYQRGLDPWTLDDQSIELDDPFDTLDGGQSGVILPGTGG